MADKVTCPKCQAENYPTDRQCLSCGAVLQRPPAAAAAPRTEAPTPPQVRKLPISMADDRGLIKRLLDMTAENQVGSLIGLCSASLFLVLCVGVGTALGGGPAIAMMILSLLPIGLSAYFFILYTNDPDIIWPFIVCFFISGFTLWIIIAGGTFIGAAIERGVRGGPRRSR